MDKKGKHSEAPNGYYSINTVIYILQTSVCSRNDGQKMEAQWGS